MTKIHIGKNGKPSICNAQVGNCPLGSSTEHFDSMKEASDFIEKKYASDYSVFMGVMKEDDDTLANVEDDGIKAFGKDDKEYKIYDKNKNFKDFEVPEGLSDDCRKNFEILKSVLFEGNYKPEHYDGEIVEKVNDDGSISFMMYEDIEFDMPNYGSNPYTGYTYPVKETCNYEVRISLYEDVDKDSDTPEASAVFVDMACYENGDEVYSYYQENYDNPLKLKDLTPEQVNDILWSVETYVDSDEYRERIVEEHELRMRYNW